MNAPSFEAAVSNIVQRDQRYQPGAYYLVKDVLDYTAKKIHGDLPPETPRHVHGSDLVDGYRDYLLENYGPMGATVTEELGIHRGQDVGEIVYALIEERVFWKNDEDQKDDFQDRYNFHEAFVQPYLPQSEQADSPTNSPD